VSGTNPIIIFAQKEQKVLPKFGKLFCKNDRVGAQNLIFEFGYRHDKWVITLRRLSGSLYLWMGG
jgi:hypothetical protein